MVVVVIIIIIIIPFRKINRSFIELLLNKRKDKSSSNSNSIIIIIIIIIISSSNITSTTTTATTATIIIIIIIIITIFIFIYMNILANRESIKENLLERKQSLHWIKEFILTLVFVWFNQWVISEENNFHLLLCTVYLGFFYELL